MFKIKSKNVFIVLCFLWSRLNKTQNWSSLLEMALSMVRAVEARGGKLRTKYLIVCFEVKLTTSEWSLLKELLALYWIPTVKIISVKNVALQLSATT